MKKSYYDKNYFDWQKHVGEFGGRANLIKFQAHIKKSDSVLDYGCGGGYLLEKLSCRKKMGIDINPIARKEAAKKGIKAVAHIRQVPDKWADILISNNALEHTKDPFKNIANLKKKLKPNGLAVFIVPCDRQAKPYHSNDVNKHLYSWSPMNLGNLFKQAGYEVIAVGPYLHKWPPWYVQIERAIGLQAFHLIARLYGYISRDWIQVKIIARNTNK